MDWYLSFNTMNMKQVLLICIVCTLWGCASTKVAPNNSKIESSVVVLDIASGAQIKLYTGMHHIEAPNWSRDGAYLLVNDDGLLFKMAFPEGRNMTQDNFKMTLLRTGNANRVNNDHGFSPDGKWIAISHDRPAANGLPYGSVVSVIPVNGGQPRYVVNERPSYWHGWSPDGQTLAYCAERNGNFDVYTMPVNGGAETRLTTNAGVDDGPEYSPDGQYIYYNSFRDGIMQIWKMHADGSGQQPVLHDEYANWFPHVSPDGTKFVTLSYLENPREAHPFGKLVKLRLYDLQTDSISDLTPAFVGGQGTINVSSWSPDGTKIAFVKYRVVE